MEKAKIFALGFEGSHRSGKGSQIEIISERLENLNIPYLVVRGDGSRPNKGESPGDPVSKWWTDFLPVLTEEGCDLENWNKSSFRLAREVRLFRRYIMPKICKQLNSEMGVLLIDRTILSRTMIPRELLSADIASNLYKDPDEKKELRIEEVCPDIIFNLIADKDVLLSRLDKQDLKYDFRRKNILEKSDWYRNATEFIPEELKPRVINIDANKTIEEVGYEIQNIIAEKIPELKILIKEKTE